MQYIHNRKSLLYIIENIETLNTFTPLEIIFLNYIFFSVVIIIATIFRMPFTECVNYFLSAQNIYHLVIINRQHE
ncbi:hypothetical protein V1477_016566 [Vespula maculifrons]|uniref:Uncharacterized protein n=1 Tax=Vespula maculifrons TaxID=7453 RepID=A0ABD2B8P5_VESMC